MGEITEKTHLSRSAVSHHQKILKDAGIIQVRHEGTKNYYFFDERAEGLLRLEALAVRARTMVQAAAPSWMRPCPCPTGRKIPVPSRGSEERSGIRLRCR